MFHLSILPQLTPIGPLFGGIIVTRLNWRWIYGILAIVCAFNTSIGYLFLRETYAPAILSEKRWQLAKENGGKYTFEGQDDRPLKTKLRYSLKRPGVIFIQPIVLAMSVWQALIFATL